MSKNSSYIPSREYQFITFLGEKFDNSDFTYGDGGYTLRNPLEQTKENIGKICFSKSENLGRFSARPEYFGFAKLGDEEDPIDALVKAMKEASEYLSVIGYLAYKDEAKAVRFLIEQAQTNAYAPFVGEFEGFPIIFNAYPAKVSTFDDGKIITIGYDKYALRYRPFSAIVWNLDRYQGIELPQGLMSGETHGRTIQLWGFAHDVEGFSVPSATGDSIVGLVDGEMIPVGTI
jgi:hypothetical protein